MPQDAANACWKACDLLKSSFGITQNVTITIKKNIPVKAGLAGGSANAATTLSLCNELWHLKLDNDSLIELARKIGMDVPFFFCANTAFDTEAGGTLVPIDTSFRMDAILVTPNFGVSTKEAYRNIDYSCVAKEKKKTKAMMKALAENDSKGVIDTMHNDFELSVFPRHPPLAMIKQKLLNAGCLNVFMSGSGSAMIGILESPKDFTRMQCKIGSKSFLVASFS